MKRLSLSALLLAFCLGLLVRGGIAFDSLQRIVDTGITKTSWCISTGGGNIFLSYDLVENNVEHAIPGKSQNTLSYGTGPAPQDIARWMSRDGLEWHYHHHNKIQDDHHYIHQEIEIGHLNLIIISAVLFLLALRRFRRRWKFRIKPAFEIKVGGN